MPTPAKGAAHVLPPLWGLTSWASLATGSVQIGSRTPGGPRL